MLSTPGFRASWSPLLSVVGFIVLDMGHERAGTAPEPGDSPASVQVRAFADLVTEVRARADYGLSDDEVLADLQLTYRLGSMVEDLKLTALHRLTTRPDLVQKIAPASTERAEPGVAARTSRPA